jgi:hypothetical protein
VIFAIGTADSARSGKVSVNAESRRACESPGGVPPQVRVGVHEAGQQGGVAKIDHLRAGGDLGIRPRRFDASVADHHDAGPDQRV